jgi:hypothetical protein
MLFWRAAACNKDTYTRGVRGYGSVCPDGMEKSGELCYTPCDPGYYRVAHVCYERCPPGFNDDFFGVGTACLGLRCPDGWHFDSTLNWCYEP